MQAVEITRVLRALVRDEGRTMERDHGPRAVEIARDMAAVLRYRLREEGPFDTLWDDFVSDPEGVEPQVTGALEALAEAYPGLSRRLDELKADYDRAILPGSAASGRSAGVVQAPPRAPETVEEKGDKYSQGTYLYGNVPGGPGGEESEGRKIGTEQGGLPGYERPERGALRAPSIPGLFQSLYQAVQDHPILTSATKLGLEAQIHEIQALITRDQSLTEIDQDRFASHLKNIQRLSPDIFEVLIRELRKRESVLSDQARKVIEGL